MTLKKFFLATFKYLFLSGLIVAIGAGIAGYLIYQRLLLELPKVESLQHVQYQIPLTVYSKENLLIAQYGEKKRIPVKIQDVPPQLIHAFLAAEDDSFFRHTGVDFKGLARAAVELIKTGEKKQGGSTITMQVARNFLLTPEKTYRRKLKEILLARQIERVYSKEQILELYLNQIFMGHRAYGVGAAAQVYYGKPLRELTLAQYAMIAGLPKAPSLYNPVSDQNRALERRDYILRRMRNLHYLDEADYQAALREPSSARLQAVVPELSAPYIAEMVRQKLYQEYGDQAYASGFKVFTTIDAGLQRAADRALANALHEYHERHGYLDGPDAENFAAQTVGDTVPGRVLRLSRAKADVQLPNGSIVELKPNPSAREHVLREGAWVRIRQLRNGEWRPTRIPSAEGALVALNPADGAIAALSGGFDFLRNKYNRAVQAKRQPGSGFKPIIYASALESGYTPASMLNDAPLIIDLPGQADDWRPENYNRKFMGMISLRTGLALSRNIISVRLLKDIGIDRAIETAKRFGFTDEQLPRSLSLALGSGYASPLQMARAYAVFANGGFLIDPYFIERIESPTGETVYQAKPKVACASCENAQASADPAHAPRIISPEINFLMNSLLRDVVQKGTAVSAKSLNRQDLAGKTGTTNDQRDAWFTGYASTLVASAWLGFDNFSSLGGKETGSTAALPMWIDFMRTALKDVPESPWTPPPGIVTAIINPKTGLLLADGNKNGVKEFFIAGHLPPLSPVWESAPAGGIEPANERSLENLF